jgi:hypothetical protein
MVLFSVGERKGGQVMMKDVFPQAQFIHCYAHQLSLITKQVPQWNQYNSIFLPTYEDVCIFYSSSPKHSDLLTVCGHTAPKSVETPWNFLSRFEDSVYINKDSLLECFDIIYNKNGGKTFISKSPLG